MNEKRTDLKPLKANLSRRNMIKNGAALLGTGLFGSLAIGADGIDEKNGHSIYDVKEFGATGHRDDNATAPIRETVETCTSNGGGMVYVPPGDYTVGTIQLKDNVALHLEAGATFFLSQDQDDFIPGARAMIYAEGAKNIAVTGRGTLDGLAQYEFTEMQGLDVEIAKEIEIARDAGMDMRRYYRKDTAMNTFMFVLNNCTHVLLQDISVIHSPLWNIRLNGCNRVYVHGMYIYSNLEKGVNADGIDICSSSNVTISDSVIITADDSIVIKTPLPRGEEHANTSENIVVTNCVLTSSSCALMIGTETHADIRHVIFSNCTIRNSNKGIGINVQDGATVSDVIFSHLTVDTNRRHWNWWGSAELCKFVLKKRSESSRLGQIKNIVIDTIISHPRGTSTIAGHLEQPIENLRISNVQIHMKPEDARDKRATHALKIENVKDLRIRDLSIDWTEDQTEEKWQSALALKQVTSVDISSFTSRQGLRNGDAPAILLEDVSMATIRDSFASEGTRAFVHVQGSNSEDIILRDNHVKKAEKDVTFQNEPLKNAVKKVE